MTIFLYSFLQLKEGSKLQIIRGFLDNEYNPGNGVVNMDVSSQFVQNITIRV